MVRCKVQEGGAKVVSCLVEVGKRVPYGMITHCNIITHPSDELPW